MKKLTLACIGSLEQYEQQRAAVRPALIQHRKTRRVSLGPNSSLHFEDYMSVKYQVQEMMRAELLRDPASLADEIAVYNPLIPDGNNLKCTFMIEFSDPAERRTQLQLLHQLEQHVHIHLEGFDPVAPIADEDMARSTEQKTSAVHFLRYEFSTAMIEAAKQGANWAIFSDHPAYRHRVDRLPVQTTLSLCRDFG